MTDLSPAAQLLDAYKNAPDLTLDGDPDEVERRLGLAATLRALADQVVPEGGAFLSPGTAAGIRAHILAIATELKAQP